MLGTGQMIEVAGVFSDPNEFTSAVAVLRDAAEPDTGLNTLVSHETTDSTAPAASTHGIDETVGDLARGHTRALGEALARRRYKAFNRAIVTGGIILWAGFDSEEIEVRVIETFSTVSGNNVHTNERAS